MEVLQEETYRIEKTHLGHFLVNTKEYFLETLVSKEKISAQPYYQCNKWKKINQAIHAIVFNFHKLLYNTAFQWKWLNMCVYMCIYVHV